VIIIDILLQAEAVLRASSVSETPRLDAEVMLADVLGIDRSRLIASYSDWIDTSAAGQFQRRVERRARGEPVSYITGKREFMGLSFRVDGRVLIPRAETETLVEYVLHAHRESGIRQVLDVGTGSGCIAVSLAVYLADAVVYATDVSAVALEVARKNADIHRVERKIQFYQGFLFDGLPQELKGTFDVIVSNPPYIPDYEYPLLQKNVREFEPPEALRGGPDGLDCFRKLAGECPDWLAKDGMLAVELGEGQMQKASALLAEKERIEVVDIVRDLAGKQRVIVGRRKA